MLEYIDPFQHPPRQGPIKHSFRRHCDSFYRNFLSQEFMLQDELRLIRSSRSWSLADQTFKKTTFALRQITVMNDIEKLQHFEHLTTRLDQLEAKKEAAVGKALQEGRALYNWNENIETRIGHQAARKTVLEASGKILALSAILLGAFELYKGGLEIFRWFQKRTDDKKWENEWRMDVFERPGNGLAQTTGGRKRLHAREW